MRSLAISPPNTSDRRSLLWLPGFGGGQYVGAIMGFVMSCPAPVLLDVNKLAAVYNATPDAIQKAISRLVKKDYLVAAERAHYYAPTPKAHAVADANPSQSFTMLPGCSPSESVVFALAIRMDSRTAAAHMLQMHRTTFHDKLKRAIEKLAIADRSKVAAQTDPIDVHENNIGRLLKLHGDWDLIRSDRGRIGEALVHCRETLGYTDAQVESGIRWMFKRMKPNRWNPNYVVKALMQIEPYRHPFGRALGEKRKKLEDAAVARQKQHAANLKHKTLLVTDE